MSESRREGSLEAPTRHPLDWRSDAFYDDKALFEELERVFDICHGCRRCFNLCNSFPTLFDLVDESDTMEVDGVAKKDYWRVVDHCYLCDMCYMSKCPYVPPHEWNVDFPHLMLRAKAVRFKKEGASFRDRVLSSTDRVGKLAGIPVVSKVVNATNRSKSGRGLLEKTLGVHRDAPVPAYHSKSAQKRLKSRRNATGDAAVATDSTSGKVVLYTTCYGNRNHPAIDEDIVTVFEHNGIPIALAVLVIEAARRCGLDAQGVNFPGHFLVKLADALVDPLSMRVLRPDEINTGNQELERLLTPATPLMVGLRMLNNIKALHIANGRLDEALETIDFQMALDPENRESVSSLHYERGELWQQLGAHSAAKAAYLSCAEISPFPKLAEQAKVRADQLGDGDEVWH